MRPHKSIDKRLIDVGLFESSPDKTLAYYEDFYRRLDELEQFLVSLVEEHSPDAMAIEAFSYPRQAKAAVYLAGSHAIVQSVAKAYDVPFMQMERSRVLAHVGVYASGRGRDQRRKTIKAGIIHFCDKHWPNANWPKAKGRREHPADAAATAYALLESKSHQVRLFTCHDTDTDLIVASD